MVTAWDLDGQDSKTSDRCCGNVPFLLGSVAAPYNYKQYYRRRIIRYWGNTRTNENINHLALVWSVRSSLYSSNDKFVVFIHRPATLGATVTAWNTIGIRLKHNATNTPPHDFEWDRQGGRSPWTLDVRPTNRTGSWVQVQAVYRTPIGTSSLDRNDRQRRKRGSMRRVQPQPHVSFAIEFWPHLSS